MSDTPRTDAQKRGDFAHIKFARELERELNVANNWVEHHQNHCDDLMKENSALREALASAEVGLKHALMMEPGDPFKRIKAITAALDAVRAAKKEAQP